MLRRSPRCPGAVAAVTALLLAAPALAHEPGDECGLVLSPEEAQVALRLRAAGAYTLPAGGAALRGTCQIPLTIHVVRRTNGTGGLEANWIAECIADASAAYAPIGVSFFQAGPTDFINSDALFSISNLSETNQLRNMNAVPGTINIYFVEDAYYCGISSFTFSSVQGVVMNNGCTPRDGNHSTFPHELGHYFDLFHTHETAYGAECPSGSNCATAGDLVCDTAADPGLSGVVNTACAYTGSAQFACGEDTPYNPPTLNYMSYSRKECRTIMTQQQYDRALATILNLRPEFACSAACPADWNGDDAVNSTDISAYLTAWLGSLADGTLAADVNADNAVNSSDISAFLSMWVDAVQHGC